MIVREDDTLICRECYEDSDEARDSAVLPAHRHVAARITTSEPCGECGRVERPDNVRLADRLNAAYAVLRHVVPRDGDRWISEWCELLPSHDADDDRWGTFDALGDDVLEAARLLRSLTGDSDRGRLKAVGE
jgi:hypothetical protein